MEIKLPRVKVEVREDEGFSLGKLSPALIVGFGAHWAWVYLTMFNGQQLFFWNAAACRMRSWDGKSRDGFQREFGRTGRRMVCRAVEKEPIRAYRPAQPVEGTKQLLRYAG